MPSVLGSLADLKAWWGVLLHALRMAPHPSARPEAEEAAFAAYLPKVLALLTAANWLSARVREQFAGRVFAPFSRLRGHVAELGAADSPLLSLPDLAMRAPRMPEGLTPILPPWVIAKAAEIGVLLGAMLLLVGFLVPRAPRRSVIALGLAAAASATLYNMLAGAVLFRMEDAFGVAARFDAALDPGGRPTADFDAALRALMTVLVLTSVAGLAAPAAMVVCVARGYRAFGQGGARAWAAALLACLPSFVAGVLSHRTGFGDWLVRALSF